MLQHRKNANQTIQIIRYLPWKTSLELERCEIRPLRDSAKPDVTWILQPQISNIEVVDHVEDSSCVLWPAQKNIEVEINVFGRLL